MAQEMEDGYLPNDFVVIEGTKQRVPTFYDNMVSQQQTDIGYWTTDKTGFPIYMPYKSISDRTELEAIKDKRIRSARKHSDNNSKERLAVREEIQLLRLQKLTRS